MQRTLLRSLLGLVAIALLIQLIPYGRDHTNPPVLIQIRWDSPSTEALFSSACADCHSNQTVWPWYSSIARSSWLVQHDVEEGRAKLNVSEGTGETEDLAQVIQEGEMPPRAYTLMHPKANLTTAQRDQLLRGLEATFGFRGEHHEETD